MDGKQLPLNSNVEKPTAPGANALGALRQFVRKPQAAERCELCSTALAHEHTHLIELSARRLICACDACALLFDNSASRRYKRVPRRVRLLQSFHMTDVQWDGLLIPINMAFFFRSTMEERVAAFYPSPAGAVESLLSLDAWNDIAGENPALGEMEADVEALVVNRVGYVPNSAKAEYFIAPIDACYRLVGLIRSNWRGLSGGAEVWEKINAFFDELRERAEIVTEGPNA